MEGFTFTSDLSRTGLFSKLLRVSHPLILSLRDFSTRSHSALLLCSNRMVLSPDGLSFIACLVLQT